MLAAEDVLADANPQTSLIDQVLACAEKDININDILRYIVTIHKNEESNGNLIAVINNPESKEQIKTLITFFYTTWLGRCTGELFKLTLDTCCIPAHFDTTKNAINEFISQNEFPQSGKRSLPGNHLHKLNTIIGLVQNQQIKPFEDHEIPQDNYIFQALKSIFTKPNISKALENIRSDSNRIFNYEALKASNNFKNALNIIKDPLLNFLKEYKPPEQSVIPAPFIHTFNTEHGKDAAQVKPEIDEYANLSLIDTVKKYLDKRKAENKKYHFWGRLFAFTSKPFSVEDKENAIKKIIYWKERETNKITDESNDINNQFSPRDIAAIHDHRLGNLCKRHHNELQRLFKFAESKIPTLVEVPDTARLLPPSAATNP